MNRTPLALAFTAGIAFSAALVVLVDRPCPQVTAPVPPAPTQAPDGMPRSREQAAVLHWIFENRADAGSLEFLTWSAPTQVADNPFVPGPATLVKLTLKNKSTASENVEHLSFYLRNFEVLGSLPYSNMKATFSM